MKEAGIGCGAIVGGILAIFAAIVLVWMLVMFSFGIHVATAGLIGRGEARIRIESGTNRIEKQELFETLWADVRKYDAQIKAVDVTAPHGPENLNGLKLICISTVEQYNAEARKVSSEQFRAADLPASISAAAHCGSN